MLRFLIVLFAVALAGTGCGEKDDPQAARSQAVDALFATFDEGVQPGAAVLVVVDGKIVHEGGYGYADIAAERRITPETPFRLASVSKQFTTMAIMLLAEEGRLSYDDPLVDWLPALDGYPGVTIRHLMQHLGGLPDYYDDVPDDSERLSNADVEVLLAERASPVFAPGERYEYSNPGYEMLANVIERASGMPFADFMRERVFRPAGMRGTLVHDHRWPTIPGRALGYAPDGDGFVLEDASPLNGVVGSGSQFSPLLDFWHWDTALRGEGLVSREALEEAWTPGRTNDGEPTGYGFGWTIEEYADRRRVRHGGSWLGFRTHIARYPDDGLTIVILSNRSDFEPESFIDPIYDIYSGG